MDNPEPNDAEVSNRDFDEIPPRPFSSRVNVDLFGMTDKGLFRTTNQDHFLIVRAGRALETVLTSLSKDDTMPGELFEESGYGMVIADGIGNDAGGELASRQAIYTLLSLALHTPDWQFRWGPKEKNTVRWRMKDRFRRVNAALLRDATANALDARCTTMTAALTQGTDLLIGHIGDSSAYLLHRGELLKLTSAPTVRGRLVQEGPPLPSDPLVLELRGLLLQTLGAREDEFNPQVNDYLLEDEDQLLLCTAGLTDMVEDREIETILNTASSAKSACRCLVDLALKNGGRENVTVIVARYSIPPDRSSIE